MFALLTGKGERGVGKAEGFRATGDREMIPPAPTRKQLDFFTNRGGRRFVLKDKLLQRKLIHSLVRK